MPIIAPGNPLFTTPTWNLTPEQDGLRWRAVAERLQNIERALGMTVKFNAVAAPGGSEIVAQTVRAGYIVIPNGAQTPPPVQIGILGTYTDPRGVTSPAETGIRVLDLNNNIVFDTVGIAQSMSSIAQQSSGVLNQVIAGAVTAHSINSSSITFSLTRQVNILTMYSAIFSVPSGGTGFAYVNARMDASDAGGNSHHFMLNTIPSGSTNTPFVMGFHVRVDTLAGASGGTNHTADITCDVDASTSIQVYKTGIYVFQAGG
jgi:hypothetical protein